MPAISSPDAPIAAIISLPEITHPKKVLNVAQQKNLAVKVVSISTGFVDKNAMMMI